MATETNELMKETKCVTCNLGLSVHYSKILILCLVYAVHIWGLLLIIYINKREIYVYPYEDPVTPVTLALYRHTIPLYLVGIGVETNACTHSDNEHMNEKLDKYYLLLTCLKYHTKYLGLPITIVAAVTSVTLLFPCQHDPQVTLCACIFYYRPACLYFRLVECYKLWF